MILSCRYAIDAVLDARLSKQLAARKLFVGQKVRVILSFLSLIRTFPLKLPLAHCLFCPVKIWGAGLCGWVGPVSPLEVLTSFTFL